MAISQNPSTAEDAKGAKEEKERVENEISFAIFVFIAVEDFAGC